MATSSHCTAILAPRHFLFPAAQSQLASNIPGFAGCFFFTAILARLQVLFPAAEGQQRQYCMSTVIREMAGPYENLPQCSNEGADVLGRMTFFTAILAARQVSPSVARNCTPNNLALFISPFSSRHF